MTFQPLGDIVSRLRTLSPTSADFYEVRNMAADKIERLRAALEIYADDANWRRERRISGMNDSAIKLEWLGPPTQVPDDHIPEGLKHHFLRNSYSVPEGPEIAQRALGKSVTADKEQ